MMSFDFMDFEFLKGSCIVVPAMVLSDTKEAQTHNKMIDLILDTGATSVHISIFL